MARFTVRFSLRSLLLITTTVNVLAAIAVTCLDERQRNRDAATILSKAGVFHNPYAAQPWHIGLGSRVSFVLHGGDETKQLISFIAAPIYKRDRFSDAHTPYFLECDNLEEVSLFECAITDRSMNVFAKMTRLSGLHIVEAPITSDGMAHLRGHSGLKWLSLDKTLIDDDACRDFATIANLRMLSCNDTQITDNGLMHLGVCRSLESVRIDFANVTDEGVARLASLPRLRTLSLRGTRVTGRAFASSGFKSLKELYLDESPVDDEGLRHISRLPALGELGVNDTLVTERGVQHLKASPSPIYLYARTAHVRPELVSAINVLQEARTGR